MKNKKTLKLLILLILSIILFYVINSYGMNYNSDFYVNDTLSCFMSPVPILFIGYLLYMILEPVIEEPLKKYFPLIYIFISTIGIFYLVIRFF